MSKMMVVKTTIVHNDNISFLQVPRRLQVRFVQLLPQDAGSNAKQQVRRNLNQQLAVAKEIIFKPI